MIIFSLCTLSMCCSAQNDTIRRWQWKGGSTGCCSCVQSSNGKTIIDELTIRMIPVLMLSAMPFGLSIHDLFDLHMTDDVLQCVNIKYIGLVRFFQMLVCLIYWSVVTVWRAASGYTGGCVSQLFPMLLVHNGYFALIYSLEHTKRC